LQDSHFSLGGASGASGGTGKPGKADPLLTTANSPDVSDTNTINPLRV